MSLWRQMQEKGSTWGMLLTVFIYRLGGRMFAEPVLWGIAAYFFLTDARIRRMSRGYLGRIAKLNGTPPPNAWTVYRHMLTFAQTSLDRFDIWTDRLEAYTFHDHGNEHVIRLLDQRRGAILISAHLGNFDALRALAKRRGARVRILTDRRHSQKFTALLKRYCPGAEEGVVNYDAGSVDLVFDLKQAIEQGEFIGLLGDRVAAESARGLSRVSEADFLGEKAFFPQHPFIFAHHVGCPVLLLFGLRRSAQVYDLYVEPFADRIELPEESRDAALAGYAAAYAARLEHFCRLYPLQWFNFYDFWKAL